MMENEQKKNGKTREDKASESTVENGSEYAVELLHITKVFGEYHANDDVTILSANAFVEDKEASIQAGMNDHVAKPINIKELKTVLMRFIKRI